MMSSGSRATLGISVTMNATSMALGSVVVVGSASMGRGISVPTAIPRRVGRVTPRSRRDHNGRMSLQRSRFHSTGFKRVRARSMVGTGHSGQRPLRG